MLPQAHSHQRCLSFCQVKEKQHCWNSIRATSLYVFSSLPEFGTVVSEVIKGALPLDLNIEELRIDIVKPYLHVYQSHSKRLLLTKLIR